MKRHASVTQRMAAREGEFESQMPDDPPEDRAEMPFEHEVRQRAHEIFEQRGRQPGDALEDWLQAERQVLAEHDAAQAQRGDEP